MPGKLGKTSWHAPTLSAASHELDPYLPRSGNLGYRVSRYDLELEYKVNSNRLAGTVTITASSYEHLKRFSLDLSSGMRVERVTVNGRRVRYSHRFGKLTITPADPVPTGGALMVEVRYGGTPRPVRTDWGTVGWEELENGSLCANQPNGAPSGSRATTILRPRRPSASRSPPTRRTTRSPTADWSEAPPGRTDHVGVRAGGTDGHLPRGHPDRPVRTPHHDRRSGAHARVDPPKLSAQFDVSFGRQPQMIKAFTEMFGPYPFPEYTAVVTEDDLGSLSNRRASRHSEPTIATAPWSMSGWWLTNWHTSGSGTR